MKRTTQINMLAENPVLECEWLPVLTYANSSPERSRAMFNNRMIRSNLYPLTSSFLNNYYIERGSPFPEIYEFNCSASMYSFFKQFYGQSLESGSGRGVPKGATPGVASTGFLPFGLPFGLDVDLLPWWVWVLLIGGAGLYIKDKLD